MLIVCPNCSATYRIELSALGASGRNVRCARCKEVWLASALDAVTADFIADSPAQNDAPPPPASRNALVHSSMPDPEPLPDASSSDSPSIVPDMARDESPGLRESAMTAGFDDVETAASRRARLLTRPKLAKRKGWMSRPVAAILVMASLMLMLVAFRETIVRAAPQTASLYEALGLEVNLRGLTFENVKVTRENADGITLIGIEGLIANMRNQPASVPRLRFSVRDAAGQEKYAWTAMPNEEVIQPGEALPFASRLASPPADAAEVLVRFFTRADAVGGRVSERDTIEKPVKPARGAH